MSLCANCTKGAGHTRLPSLQILISGTSFDFLGVRHEGTPTGTIETVAGVQCYVATPQGPYAREKAVLLLTDVFGMQLENSQLLADDFARNGFKTIVPDYFSGDACHKDALSGGAPWFDVRAWFARHPLGSYRAPIDSVIAQLRAEGVTRLGATGYCLGGRSVFDLAFDRAIDVAVVAHPSFIAVPDDLQRYLGLSHAPLLINSCGTDDMFPPSASAEADAILGGGRFAPGYARAHFEGCAHGFAVRGDLSDPKAKAAKEGAFEGSVEWFVRYL
ncbi:hypothetical protein HWV62_37322 [Athelia sp. TMB]|nr:hypothetical protein HWV62_37322 [Athelia sp. TMB]